ncbi:phosphate-induced protein 1 conserved region-domain-containing protein [Chytriomyces sp. MP71]|nr:phosphate-induced protein 1 conserved region-domain-containing protein [Chytriomyces sp. MP71]
MRSICVAVLMYLSAVGANPVKKERTTRAPKRGANTSSISKTPTTSTIVVSTATSTNKVILAASLNTNPKQLVTYRYGQPVMQGSSTKLYPIFYGPTWTTSQKNHILAFLSSFSPASKPSPPWFDTLHLYYSANTSSSPLTYISGYPTLVKPAQVYGFTTMFYGLNVNYTQMPSLISVAIQSAYFGPGTTTPDPNGIYMLIGDTTITNDYVCKTLCGFHDTFNINGVAVKWLYTSNTATQCPSGCGVAEGQSPLNGGIGDAGTDALVNILAHEIAETMVDPLGTSWIKGSGTENGDVCNFVYGPPVTLGARHDYQAVWEGSLVKYRIQTLYNPWTNVCVISP